MSNPQPAPASPGYPTGIKKQCDDGDCHQNATSKIVDGRRVWYVCERHAVMVRNILLDQYRKPTTTKEARHE